MDYLVVILAAFVILVAFLRYKHKNPPEPTTVEPYVDHGFSVPSNKDEVAIIPLPNGWFWKESQEKLLDHYCNHMNEYCVYNANGKLVGKFTKFTPNNIYGTITDYEYRQLQVADDTTYTYTIPFFESFYPEVQKKLLGIFKTCIIQSIGKEIEDENKRRINDIKRQQEEFKKTKEIIKDIL